MTKVPEGKSATVHSLGRQISLVVGAVFCSDLLMRLLVHLLALERKVATLAEPFLLSLFLLPLFLFFIYRPIREKLVERREYERNFHHAYDALEATVQERTEELYEKNESLYREIAEKKRAAEELREKNAFLEIIIESLDHPFYVIDANTYVVKLANRATGFKERKEKAKCYELTHNREAPCAGDDGDPCLIARVVETGEPQIAIHTHYNPEDGTKKQVEIHTLPIFDAGGRVSSVIEFVMDCQRRRCSERQDSLNQTWDDGKC